jgi:heme exporter protein A
VRRRANLLHRESVPQAWCEMRLIAEKVAAERGGEEVFSDVSFVLSDGEALVVTGENGTGKSTLLKVVAGLIAPTAGRIALEGAGEAWPDVAAACHHLGHENAMKATLTVAENLAFWRDFNGEPHLEVSEALEMVGLETTAALPFGYLSTGQRRRIAIARLLVSYRPVWLLDEPTAGLDARSERQFAALIEAHREDGGIVVAATHVALGIEGAKPLKMGEPRSSLRAEPDREADRGGGGDG